MTHRGTARQLVRGDVLTFGRGKDCTIRLPNDAHISRTAGSVTVLEDCVLIRNHSGTKPFVIRPVVGEDHIVEPGAAVTSLPHRRLQIVIAGMAGTTVHLDLDVTGVTRPVSCPDVVAVASDVVTTTTPFPLTPAQRKVVEALCAPMLSQRGADATPATYQQIGASLGLSPQYVRNVIQTVRETLTGHGVPDLVTDDPTRPGADFRWSLARYAIRNRWFPTAAPAEEQQS
ncbi:hypothetical protein ACWEOZ_18565 [Actinoplanes sp. NPDC004185]